MIRFVVRHGRTQMNPSLALMWRHIDKLGEEFDYFTAARQASEQTGLQFWVYHPHIYSEGRRQPQAAKDQGAWCRGVTSRRCSRSIPSSSVSIVEETNIGWCRSMATQMRARQKVAEFVHMAKKYGIKHFIANMRSEVSQLQDPADNADRFGFNRIVADDMQRLHGVDIMTDPALRH